MVFGLHGGTETVLFALRHVAAVLGAATCVLTFLLVERAGGRRLAAVAGAAARHRPPGHQLRQPGHARGAGPAGGGDDVPLRGGRPTDATRSVSSRRHWLWAAGLAGATVLCTKETFGLVVVLALAGLVATGWVRRPARGPAVLGLALARLRHLPSSPMGFVNGFGVWWERRSAGCCAWSAPTRSAGSTPRDPRVASVAGVRRRPDVRRDLPHPGRSGCWPPSGCSGGLSRGTGAVPTASSRNRVTRADRPSGRCRPPPTWPTPPSSGRSRSRCTTSCSCRPPSASACGWPDRWGTGRRPWRARRRAAARPRPRLQHVVWVNVHTGRDDEYRRLVSWEAVHVAPTAVVAATDDVSQFLLPGASSVSGARSPS